MSTTYSKVQRQCLQANISRETKICQGVFQLMILRINKVVYPVYNLYIMHYKLMLILQMKEYETNGDEQVWV